MMGRKPHWRWMRRYRERVLGREAGKRAAVSTRGGGMETPIGCRGPAAKQIFLRNSGDERQARKRL